MTIPLDELGVISPLATPLPPLPEGDVLTPAQWATLMAIGDTVISSLYQPAHASQPILQPQSTQHQKILDRIQVNFSPNNSKNPAVAYLEEKASSIPYIKESIHRTLANYVRPEQRRGIAVILSALEYALYWYRMLYSNLQ